MLPDNFFTEYAQTGATPKAESPAAEPEPAKEFYTRAEVDQMISERIAEAISAIREEQLKVVSDPTPEPEPEPVTEQ